MTPYLDRERAPAIGGGGEPAIENAANLAIEWCAPAIAATGLEG